MLRYAGIEYKVFETDSPTYVNDWIDLYSASSFNFTDIICIGGDGLFSQLLNAIGNHPDREELIKIPIGIIPCGSQNAIACDTGGKNPYHAAINIVRGASIKADIMKVHFQEQDTIVYATSFLWGISSDIVTQSEKWRPCFGSARYTM